MTELDIDVSISEPEWTQTLGNARQLCRRAVTACPLSKEMNNAVPCEVSILLCDDVQMQALNKDYRQQDKPTNVLSFANVEETQSLQFGPTMLGDIVIAFGVASQEAKDQGKTLADHLSHLVVHGMLHLLGHDHQDNDQAGRMEALEISTLAGLGVADPYDTSQRVEPK